MDLGSMLNTESAPTNMDQEAVSLFRRLSNGSASASPGQSPVVTAKQLQRQSSDAFRTPDPPKDRSTPPAKRKIDQVHSSPVPDEPRQKIKTTEDNTARTQTVAPSKPPRPRIDCAYDGSKSYNDINSRVGEAISYYLTAVGARTYGKLGVEIEAKLGRITERASDSRMHDLFPIDSCVLLHPGFDDLRFTSDMTNEQHARFNRHLNEQVELQNPKHAAFDASRPKMTYLHTHLTDSLYPPTDVDGRALKPRVTMNDRDGSLVETIAKENITHLHVVCPRHPFDVRISINLEHRVQVPVGQEAVHVRKKDRLSYRLPTHQIDLTKVDGGDRRSYELEVELGDMENLKRQAQASVDGDSNCFDDLVQGFMGTVMRLNRAAVESGS